MKYLLLIYSDESQDEGVTQEEQMAVLGAYNAYTQALVEAGALQGAEALQPTATATTVSNLTGKTLTTHGPFAETTEQLGGYYLIDCANLDEAIAWAAKCPGADHGKVEIRPVIDFG